MKFMVIVMLVALASIGLSVAASEDEGSMASNLDDASIFSVGKTGMSPGVGVGAQKSQQSVPIPLGSGVPVVASLRADDAGPVSGQPLVESSVTKVENATAPQEEAQSEEQEAAVASVAGNWSLLLPDEVTVDLTLQQVDAVVFGKASLSQGNYSQELTAAGLVQQQNATLYLMDLTGSSLYLFNLTVADQEASGDFTLYGPSGVIVHEAVSGFGN